MIALARVAARVATVVMDVTRVMMDVTVILSNVVFSGMHQRESRQHYNGTERQNRGLEHLFLLM